VLEFSSRILTLLAYSAARKKNSDGNRGRNRRAVDPIKRMPGDTRTACGTPNPGMVQTRLLRGYSARLESSITMRGTTGLRRSRNQVSRAANDSRAHKTDNKYVVDGVDDWLAR